MICYIFKKKKLIACEQTDNRYIIEQTAKLRIKFGRDIRVWYSLNDNNIMFNSMELKNAQTWLDSY